MCRSERTRRSDQQQDFPIGEDKDILALQAKQRELLERRRADLSALDRRLTLVPDLALVGMAIVE